MATIDWYAGESEDYIVIPRDEAGNDTGGSYMAAQLRIRLPLVCLALEGVAGVYGGSEGFSFAIEDSTVGDSPIGTWPMSLWLEDARGWRRIDVPLDILIGDSC